MGNEIKPPAGFGPFIDPAGDNSVESSRDASFQKTQDALRSSESSSTPTPGLSAIAQFSQAELQDPEKLDRMVRASLSELIDSSQNLSGPLSTAEKQSLVDFLSQDPLIRRQVEGYLRKVVT
jgi:hypothetical protein